MGSKVSIENKASPSTSNESRKSRKSRKSRNSGGERPSSLLQVYFTSASSACGGDVCFGKYTSLLLGGGFYFSAVLH